MKIQIQIINDLGSFSGEILEMSQEQYIQTQELSKNFYDSGFEMDLEDGGFIIFPPDIIKKSILKINKINV